MCEQRFTVIGISDSQEQCFAPKVMEIIANGQVFSGGKRHQEIMEPYLPVGHEWIPITVPLQKTFYHYAGHKDIIVFASGDPLFYGIATTLMREFPEAKIEVLPTFNSLQMLSHALCLPYHEMTYVSVTGRPWGQLDAALIEGGKQIGVLTDRTKTPAAIAQRMLDYGYDNYEMIVGENLGNEEKQCVVKLPLSEAVNRVWNVPNCLILQQTHPRKRYFGIPESEFMHLDNRRLMITKMPIRLLALSMLDLCNRQSFWDVGFCTGSVSIEAKLQFPHLKVTSFEIRPQCEAILQENCRRFGAPGITPVMGDFFEADLSTLPRPDAVFIGGHGGKLKTMVRQIKHYLLPDGIIVFNSVNINSLNDFQQGAIEASMEIVDSHSISLDIYNTITILKAK